MHLNYHNLLQINTNLILEKYRNLASVFLYSLPRFFFCTIIVMYITSACAINQQHNVIIIASYNCMSLKEIKT